jgi:thiamine-phosphate pyrophosphorylase
MCQLVVISQATMLPGEAAIIQQLFEAGLEYFHLRKPDADEQAVRALIEAIPAVYHNRIAIHGFFPLMDEYDLRRWHFREEQRQATDEGTLLQLQEKGYILSTSVHDLLSIQQLPALFSYTFLSPVFDSISKQQYKGFANDDFYLHEEQKAVPVIALGGIDAGNIRSVVAMNFDGAALLGTIWKEPASAVRNFKLVQQQLTLSTSQSAK